MLISRQVCISIRGKGWLALCLRTTLWTVTDELHTFYILAFDEDESSAHKIKYLLTYLGRYLEPLGVVPLTEQELILFHHADQL
jgi:hypothetical protein